MTRPVAWRQGYATEATRAVADELRGDGISALEATIAPGHAASEGVARNLGMAVTNDVVDGERVWRDVMGDTAMSPAPE